MEFMESLYEIENFGIYLFIVIGILVLAFLITLFFGHKDEQNSNLEKKEEEVPSIDTFSETSSDVKVEVPVVNDSSEDNNLLTYEESAPVEESTPAMDASVISPVLEEKHDDEIKITNDIVNEVSEPVSFDKTFDFDALAAAISKDLDDIEKNATKKEEPVKESKPTVSSIPRTEVFSSVYVDRAKEKNIKEKPEEMELPKMVELPKTKE